MGKCSSLARCRCGLIPDSYHHGSIRVPIVDESVIWKYYTLISGRFMVRHSQFWQSEMSSYLTNAIMVSGFRRPDLAGAMAFRVANAPQLVAVTVKTQEEHFVSSSVVFTNLAAANTVLWPHQSPLYFFFAAILRVKTDRRLLKHWHASPFECKPNFLSLRGRFVSRAVAFS